MIGANGFIGSHLVDSLSRAGQDVTAFDRFSSPSISYNAPGVKRVVGDFLSHADLTEALAGQQYVFHFVSTTNPATADNEPTLDIRTNVSQSIDLFSLCVQQGVERLYFASTGGAIYGDQGLSRYCEEDPALPLSPYSIGKLTIEHYLRYFKAKYGLTSVSLRISNPYGGRQHPHRKQGLIPIALRRILTGQPVLRFGTGEMIRDFIYVGDVANMVASMVTVDAAHPVYNIGSGVGHSVNEVFAAIRTVTDQDFEILETPPPRTYVDEVVLNTSRFESEFGLHALTPLTEGIRKTWHTLRASNTLNRPGTDGV